MGLFSKKKKEEDSEEITEQNEVTAVQELPADKRAAKKILEEKIINMLKTIYDPEIPVDIFELGLIYEIRIDDDYNVGIEMTLTSPNCPVAESLPAEVKEKTGMVNGIQEVAVNIIFDPPWTQDMMSEEAMLELGFL